MHIHFKILFFILTVISLFENSNWQKFTSEEGRFSVMIPGEFVRSDKLVNTDIGEMPCTSFVFQDTFKFSKNKLYVINYCDYPVNTFHRDSIDLIEELLEISVVQENENLRGQITYDHKKRIEGYPGRMFRINYNNGNIVLKSKIFLVQDRFYTIKVYTEYKKSLNFDIDKFFNSFRLLE